MPLKYTNLNVTSINTKNMKREQLITKITLGWLNEIRVVNPKLETSDPYCDYVYENVIDKVEQRFNYWREQLQDELTIIPPLTDTEKQWVVKFMGYYKTSYVMD